MKCEVKDCEYSTEHTNTYEVDDKMMTRHLTVHLIEGLRDIARYLTHICIAQHEPQDEAAAPVSTAPKGHVVQMSGRPATPVSAPPISERKLQ